MHCRAAADRALTWLAQAWRGRFRRARRLGTRILVVRGSHMAGEMARMLRRHGLTIDLVDRSALLECARRSQPALIVSDLSISGMSEVEEAIVLRQRLPACKVLLFSAQGLRRTSLPRESEAELVRTIERLCNPSQGGQMLWLDLARFIQITPRQKSVAA